MRLERLHPGNVTLAAVQTLSPAVHSGKNLILSELTGHTITLPKATGSGATFLFVGQVAPTSLNNIVKVYDAVDAMMGSLTVSGASTVSFPASAVANADTITLNRTTTGGAGRGERFECVDIAPGLWLVSGALIGAGAVATPFSATV